MPTSALCGGFLKLADVGIGPYGEKNMPFIPTLGTKGIPSAGPPTIRRKTAHLEAQTRSQPVTELPGVLYCQFKTQLLGEGPCIAPQAAFTIPPSLRKRIRYRTAHSSLFAYRLNHNTCKFVLQVFFWSLSLF